MAKDTRAQGTEGLIKSALLSAGLSGEDDIAVRIRVGVVYLEGCVASREHKLLAGEAAARVHGVRRVANMLRIAPRTVVSDEELQASLTRSLALHPEIDQDKVLVEIRQGIAHLLGVASTPREREAVAHAARETHGVCHVINSIQVLSETEPTGPEVADDILQGLCECLGLDPAAVTVTSARGVVELSGTVPNRYLAFAAEELACWTPSVTTVTNNLRVVEAMGQPTSPPTEGHSGQALPPGSEDSPPREMLLSRTAE